MEKIYACIDIRKLLHKQINIQELSTFIFDENEQIFRMPHNAPHRDHTKLAAFTFYISLKRRIRPDYRST